MAGPVHDDAAALLPQLTDGGEDLAAAPSEETKRPLHLPLEDDAQPLHAEVSLPASDLDTSLDFELKAARDSPPRLSHIAGGSGAKYLVFSFTILAVAAGVAVLSMLTPRLFCGSSSSKTASSACASASSSTAPSFARPLAVLPQPLVILVSTDGFRADYFGKTPTPGLDRVRLNGTWAADGMFPVYPSVTFPNHYSIATGLLPASHGIVANHFRDPADPSGPRFFLDNTEPKWWRGEPLWETVERQGLRAATCFWPGTNVVHPGRAWSCPPDRCHRTFNSSFSFDERVDEVLSWVDLPAPSRPSLITLYFEEPDESGHWGGPDTPRITAAIQRVDAAVGRLLDGLQARGVLQDVHVIIISDHGMLATCGSRTVDLRELAGAVLGLASDWVDGVGGAQAGLFPPDATPAADVAEKIKAALASGQVKNGEYLSVFLKEEAPPALNISNGDRYPPIFLSAAEGFLTVFSKGHGKPPCNCAGQHGFDNSLASMRAVFMAAGPSFAPGRIVPAFSNLEGRLHCRAHQCDWCTAPSDEPEACAVRIGRPPLPVGTRYKEKRWDFKRIFGSGGMPSSHSSTVMGLACAVGFEEGPQSAVFAACLVLAAVVMYDASGVRLQAGRQAEVLNQIVYELPPEHPLSDTQPLKNHIGHTPPQVAAGAALGCLIAIIFFRIFPTTIASP